MPTDESVFSFEWFVHLDGYCWTRSEMPGLEDPFMDLAQPFGEEMHKQDFNAIVELRELVFHEAESSELEVLHACPPKHTETDSQVRLKPIRPLKRESLFITFLSTEPTLEGILGFAQKYGFLGVGGNLVDVGWHAEATLYGEPFDLWRNEIFTMRRAFTFWEMARHGKMSELEERLIFREGEEIAYLDEDGKEKLLWIEPWDPEAKKKHHIGEPDSWFFERAQLALTPAAYYLAYRTIDEALTRNSVSPAILWRRDLARAEPDASFRFRPRTLIGALWLQLLDVVVKRIEFRECAWRECSKRFPVGLGEARSDKKTCSPRCRKLISRKGKEE